MSDNSLQFVHLHVHSEYSLSDGSIRIPQLIKKVKEWNQSAVALTDHGNLFGAIDFYSKAKAEGIKPIIGSEIYCAGWSDLASLDETLKYPEIGATHLVLLAENNAGYKNLMRIVSSGYTDGLKDVPIVSTSVLLENSSGLIALSSCFKSELSLIIQTWRKQVGINQDLDLAGDDSFAQAVKGYISKTQQLFGSENFYIEITDNNLPGQRELVLDLVKVATFYDIPLVATSDAHYLTADFSEQHAIMLGIKSGLTMKDLRGRNLGARFHLLSPDEIQEIYSAWPDAIANTQKIADRCNVTMEFGKYFLPQFSLGDTPIDEGFRAICRAKLEERLTHLQEVYGPSFTTHNQYRERLSYEIEMIIKMGFPGYFLIVQDFINWAKSEDIPVGPGRGSGAGSLVAYALKITDVDPVRFNLLFERFLNPERISMPDFDVDFCQDRRDEVIQYVTRKYGKNHVAQITTFGKMMCKAAIRDVGRVLEIGYGRVDKITKLIPLKLPSGKAPTVKDARLNEPKIEEEASRDVMIQKMLDVAHDIEGLNRQTGVHAAGIVISAGPLTDYVPVYTTPEDGLITQFEMKNAEKVGLVKFDFLGLKTLTVIHKAVQQIKLTFNPKFEILDIPLTDKKVFAMISAAHTVGVFQLEGGGMQQLLLKLKPSSFEDIIAVVALFRPGPLGSGMVDDFIDRKHGRKQIVYDLPQMEPVLRETYGVILYQEQVQKIAVVLANYSPGEADLLRRAMGKKIKAEMDAQRSRFASGAKENSIDPILAEEIFDLMAKFAEYGFNKSHSAAYGLVSYQTAYLKANYPEIFMAASMTCDLDDTDKVVRYVEDCRRLNILVDPPNINTSDLFFTVRGVKKISFALAAIKGIGLESLKPILEDREKNGIFSSLTDLAKRVNLNFFGKKNMEVLIRAGAFDFFGVMRTELLAWVPALCGWSDAFHKKKASKVRTFFDDDVVYEDSEQERLPWAQAKLIQLRTSLSVADLLAESKICGLFLSMHPLKCFPQDVKRFSTGQVAKINAFAGKKGAIIIGLVTNYQLRRTKENKPIAYVTFEDETGRVEAFMTEKSLPPAGLVFPEFYAIHVTVMKRHDGTFSRARMESAQTLENYRKENLESIRLEYHSMDSQEMDSATKDFLKELHYGTGGTGKLLKTKLLINGQGAVIEFAQEESKVELSNAFIEKAQNLKQLQLSYAP